MSRIALPDCWMAEGVGFEPTRRHYRLRDFQSRALGQTMRPFPDFDVLMIHLAERAGFEPAVAQHHTNFRDWHLKPLGHLSEAILAIHDPTSQNIR